MLRSLNEIRGLQDPLKQSQVEFVISDTPGLLLAKLSQKVAGMISDNTKTVNAKTLRLRCTSYTIPGAKIGQTELILGGHRRKLGTIQDKSGVWTCTIVEDFEGGIINTIASWCDLIHSNFLGTRLPSILYRSQAEIIMGGNKGGGNVRREKLASRTIYLHGVYPIAYKVGNIDPNSSAPVSITVDFNYDFFTDNPYSLTSGFGII